MAVMDDRVTRGGIVRIAAGAGAALAGGLALGGGGGGGVSEAAPSAREDARALNFFLLLERLQERFYARTVETGAVRGDLLTFAAAAGRQERAHVRLLAERLRGDVDDEPQADFTDALSSPERFGQAAIELEEAALAAYIAHGAALTREAVAAVVPIISVEARQAAWIRDLAGADPAPRAADPPRDAQEVLDHLREQGLLR